MDSPVFAQTTAELVHQIRQVRLQILSNTTNIPEISTTTDIDTLRAIFTTLSTTSRGGSDVDTSDSGGNKKKRSRSSVASSEVLKPAAIVSTRPVRAVRMKTVAPAIAVPSAAPVVKRFVHIPECLSVEESKFLALPKNWDLLCERFMANWDQGMVKFQKAINLLEYIIPQDMPCFVKLVNANNEQISDRLILIANQEESGTGNRLGHILFRHGTGDALYATKQGQMFVAQMFVNNKGNVNYAGMSMLQILATNRDDQFVAATIKALGSENAIDRPLIDRQHLLHRGVANINFAFLTELKQICNKIHPNEFSNALTVVDYGELMPIHHIVFLTDHMAFAGESAEEFKIRILKKRDTVFEWVKSELDRLAPQMYPQNWQINNILLNAIRASAFKYSHRTHSMRSAAETLFKMYNTKSILKIMVFFKYRVLQSDLE